ncbi:MAG TPA: uroporphyrinogen decarboxylase family protein [Armatimonadota bacterium]
MTTHERFRRMFAHQEADRVPIIDSPWGATLERWQREGLPAGVDWADYLDLDRVAGIDVDNSPRYPVSVLEETDAYRVHTTQWGATLKDWRHAGGVPEFLDFTIKDRDTWAAAKARMTPTSDRVNWDYLAANYPRWREEGRWIQGNLWFGFDVTHSYTMGTERTLIALIEDPEWCQDIFNAFLDVDLALMDQVWDAGYTFDSIFWPDDMGYKRSQFFSVATYRRILRPVHQRAIEWAHAKGIPAHMHSCGDIRPFVPELLGLGLDALNPLEVKAGVDPVALKAEYGDRLLLHGGINAVLWTDVDALEAEIRRVLPELKRSGGYIFSTDHSVPDSVSFPDFQRIIRLVKELGRY